MKIIGPLLIDENSTLRTNAVGALRNLSRAGGSEACRQMVKDDVMTPLCALFQKVIIRTCRYICSAFLRQLMQAYLHFVIALSC